MPEAAQAPAACRIDVWLWRARFFKTRGGAAALVQTGRVRLRRGGAESRPDKPGRTVRPGDELVFALGGRVAALRIEALGRRRGPPGEARALWRPLDSPRAGPAGIDKPPAGLKNTPAAPGGGVSRPPTVGP